MPPTASSLSCRRPTAETRRFDWGATLSTSRCTLMGFNLGFIPFEMIQSGSCLQRTLGSFRRSVERDENHGPDSCEICKGQGRRPAVRRQATFSSLCPQSPPPPKEAGGGDSPSPSEPPPLPSFYSLLNLLSWYEVTVSLLDSTQILRVLQNSASVLLPVTSAAF